MSATFSRSLISEVVLEGKSFRLFRVTREHIENQYEFRVVEKDERGLERIDYRNAATLRESVARELATALLASAPVSA